MKKINNSDKEFTAKEIYKFLGLGQMYFNAMGIDYIKIYEGFLQLEKVYGELPIFSVPSYFPSEFHDVYYNYQFESKRISIQSGVKMIRATLEATEIPNTENIPEIVQRLFNLVTLSFDQKKKIYLKYFDLIFENFVSPIVYREKGEPKKGFRYPYNQQIDWMKKILKDSDLEKSLGGFVDYLNGTLRNAFVHSNYFLKDDELYYFSDNTRKKKIKMNKLTLKKFSSNVGIMSLQEFIFQTVSGLRLAKIPIEELRKIASKNLFRTKDKSNPQKENIDP